MTEEILQTIAQAVADAWGTLFMKSASVSEPQLGGSELASEISGSYVTCPIQFSGDVTGEVTCYVNKIQALTMVGMMLSMGADDALIDSTREGDVGDEELDALKEAFNQLAATAATVLRDKTGGSLQTELGSLEIKEIESIDDISDEDSIAKWPLTLEGYDEEQFFLHLPKSFMEPASAPAVDTSSAPVETEKTESSSSSITAALDRMKGLKLNMNVILAERNMDLQQLTGLSVGSVVEFWKPCDDPAELMINDSVLANGEVVISDQNFGIRIQNLSPPKQKSFQKG